MIKCFLLVYRAPHLTGEQFSVLGAGTARWPSMRRRCCACAAMCIPPVHHPVGAAFRHRGCVGRFDGVAKLVGQLRVDGRRGRETPPEPRCRMLQDDARFVDLARRYLVGEEHRLAGREHCARFAAPRLD